MSDRLAAFVTPGSDLNKGIERVQLAERLGYEAVFATQIAARDLMMLLSAYASATERIKIGSGVLPAFGRHPIATASEAATLDEMSGGRLILGLGTAHAVTMKNWYGFEYAKPLTQFKEYVHIVRSILAEGRCEFSGEFYTVNFGFMGYAARPDLPIYTASLGPKSLEWAGAHADGVVLWGCMPSYIKETAVPTLRKSAQAAGRDFNKLEIVAAIPCSVADDVDAARDAFRRDFFVYMTLPFYRRAIAGAGYQAELDAFDRALAAGDTDGARAAMSETMLTEFAAIGTPEAVRSKIDEYREAGVTLPAVGAIPVPKEVGPGADATLQAAIGADG